MRPGVMLAHICSAPFNATLHLFGFNWHQVRKHGLLPVPVERSNKFLLKQDHMLTHDLISEEEALMQQTASSGQIVIHPTG